MNSTQSALVAKWLHHMLLHDPWFKSNWKPLLISFPMFPLCISTATNQIKSKYAQKRTIQLLLVIITVID